MINNRVVQKAEILEDGIEQNLPKFNSIDAKDDHVRFLDFVLC